VTVTGLLQAYSSPVPVTGLLQAYSSPVTVRGLLQAHSSLVTSQTVETDVQFSHLNIFLYIDPDKDRNNYVGKTKREDEIVEEVKERKEGRRSQLCSVLNFDI